MCREEQDLQVLMHHEWRLSIGSWFLALVGQKSSVDTMMFTFLFWREAILYEIQNNLKHKAHECGFWCRNVEKVGHLVPCVESVIISSNAMKVI